jgi:nucleoside-diphosphate-sugar epimerase
LESGDAVAVLVRPDSDPWRIADVLDQVQPIAGHLSEPTSLSRHLADFKPDVVYHLGWSGSGQDGRDDRRQQNENAEAALATVELASEAGAAAWLGLGTQAEFGPTNSVLNEATPTRPVTEYGIAKLSAGRQTAELCARRSLRHVWLRLVTAYGPADRASYLIPHVILSLLQGLRPALTEGRQPGDFLYVADASTAIRMSAVTESCGGTYVLASGEHRSVREVALAIRDMIDPRLEIGLGDVVTNRPPVGLRGDPRALELATGWSPAAPLEAGLSRCIEWYRRNLSRYSKENA